MPSTGSCGCMHQTGVLLGVPAQQHCIEGKRVMTTDPPGFIPHMQKGHNTEVGEALMPACG